MKWSMAVAAACPAAGPVLDLHGQPGLHDPATVIAENGTSSVYGTGNGLPVSVSDDGRTWRRAGGVTQAVAGGKPGPGVIARADRSMIDDSRPPSRP
jgi:hypothetical protein